MLSKSCSVSFTIHLLKYENILIFIWFNKKKTKSMKNFTSRGGGGGGAGGMLEAGWHFLTKRFERSVKTQISMRSRAD